MEITPADWELIRGIFRDGFASGFHFGVASLGEDGAPHLTPIGSLVLGAVGQGFYFEEYAAGLSRRLQRDPRVCVLAVRSSRWELLRALWRGEARRPLGVRLHGTVGARREATAREVERFQRRVRMLRLLPGHRLVWGPLRTVREVRFHAFEPVRIPPLGAPWPPRGLAAPSPTASTAPPPRTSSSPPPPR